MKCWVSLVSSLDQNLRELSANMISCFTICVKHELREWQISLFFVILSEKLANVCIISCEISEITGIGYKLDVTISNWSETRSSEMLKIAFDGEFSMNVKDRLDLSHCTIVSLFPDFMVKVLPKCQEPC